MINRSVIFRGNHAYDIVAGKCYPLGLPEGVEADDKNVFVLHEGDLYVESSWRGRIEAKKIQIIERSDPYNRSCFSRDLASTRSHHPAADQVIISNIVQHSHLFCSPPTDSYYLVRPTTFDTPGYLKVSTEKVGQVFAREGFIFWEESGKLITNVPIQSRYGIVHHILDQPSSTALLDPSQTSAADQASTHCFGANYLAVRVKATRMTKEYVVLITLTTTYSSTNPNFSAPLGTHPFRAMVANTSPPVDSPPEGAVYLKIYFLPSVIDLSKLRYDERSSTIFYLPDPDRPLIFDRSSMSFISIRSLVNVRPEMRIRSLTETHNTYYAFFDGNSVSDTRGLVLQTSHPGYIYDHLQYTQVDRIFLSGPSVAIRVQHPHRAVFIESETKVQSTVGVDQKNNRSIYIVSGGKAILRCRLDPRWFTIEPEMPDRRFGYQPIEEDSFFGKKLDPICYINTASSDPLEFFLSVVKNYRARTVDLFFAPRLWLAATEEESFQAYVGALESFRSRFLVPNGLGTSFRNDIQPSFLNSDAYGELIRIFLEQLKSPIPFRMPLEFFSIFMEKKYGTPLTHDMREYFETRWSTNRQSPFPEVNLSPVTSLWVGELCRAILEELDPCQRHPVDLDYYLSGSY